MNLCILLQAIKVDGQFSNKYPVKDTEGQFSLSLLSNGTTKAHRDKQELLEAVVVEEDRRSRARSLLCAGTERKSISMWTLQVMSDAVPGAHSHKDPGSV